MSGSVTLEINETEHTVDLLQQEVVLDLVLDTLSITVDETIYTLDITVADFTVEMIANAVITYQTFTGEGAVADGTTITGDGTSGNPLSLAPTLVALAQNSFQVPLLFSEIDSEIERQQAQQNLGLHIIDGGTF